MGENCTMGCDEVTHDAHYPMNSPDSQTAWLEDLQTILERPIRKCKLSHEDVIRDANGSAVVDKRNHDSKELPILGQFTPECLVQHIGCPHLFKQRIHRDERLLIFLEHLTEKDPSCAILLEEIKDVKNKLMQTDENVRHARVGARTAAGLFHIPSKTEAEIAAKPIIRKHEMFLEQRVEPLRVRLLGIVRDALQEIKTQDA
jgi:hypothetical protein